MFVKTIAVTRVPLSGAASHELVEMLVDPAINRYATGPDSRVVYAYETADPVEEEFFRLGGFAMSDFIYPAYFEAFHRPRSTQFDYLRKICRPFQILRGGYLIVLRNGKKHVIFGSRAKAKRFRKEDRRQHRSEFRGRRGRRAALQRSTPNAS